MSVGELDDIKDYRVASSNGSWWEAAGTRVVFDASHVLDECARRVDELDSSHYVLLNNISLLRMGVSGGGEGVVVVVLIPVASSLVLLPVSRALVVSLSVPNATRVMSPLLVLEGGVLDVLADLLVDGALVAAVEKKVGPLAV